MNAPQITKISLLHLPFITEDSYEVLVNLKNFDKTKHRVIVQVNMKNYEPDGNTVIIKIPIMPKNASNYNLRIKAFVYEFEIDKIVEAKLQEFKQKTVMPQVATTMIARAFEPSNVAKIVKYVPNDELLITTPIILGNWNKKKLVQDVITNEDEIISVNGHFYNENGSFEGKVYLKENIGNASDVYTCTEKSKGIDKNGKEIDFYKGAKLLKENNKNITHSDFCYIAYVVEHESGNEDIKELKCIAFTSFNRSIKKKSSWKELLATSYSAVENKTQLSDSNNGNKDKLTRKSLYSVLNGENDLTNGAEYWDGTDFLAWGNSETTPDNDLGQDKFRQYKFIEIPKDLYDTYLAANGTSISYNDKGKHKAETDMGTHKHTTKKVKKKKLDKDGKPVLDSHRKPIYEDVEVPNKIKYSIPAADFNNKEYWKSGSFYYETGVKVPNGISATISKGKSIFWKKTKTRLTSSTPPKK